jgi:hypothetical protein
VTTAGHATFEPEHAAARVSVPAVHEAARQDVPGASNVSAGQVGLAPVHRSTASHTPAAFRHAALASPGTLEHPVVVLHESTVHGFESSQLAAAPATQAPALHVSGVVQALPSLHVVPVRFAHVPAALQATQSFGLLPPHADWQQTPSAQKLLVHIAVRVQGFPRTSLAAHVPALQ